MSAWSGFRSVLVFLQVGKPVAIGVARGIDPDAPEVLQLPRIGQSVVVGIGGAGSARGVEGDMGVPAKTSMLLAVSAVGACR